MNFTEVSFHRQPRSILRSFPQNAMPYFEVLDPDGEIRNFHLAYCFFFRMCIK